jgi:prolyl-tRNA synthetase
MIMAHSDDEGLVLPPNVAPIVAAIVPIFKSEEEEKLVAGFIDQILQRLVGVPASAGMSSGDTKLYFFDKLTNQKIIVDWRDARPGDKQYHWEQRGVPFRIEVGPRDVQQNVFVLKRRLDRGKENVSINDVSQQWLGGKLVEVHNAMVERSRTFRDQSTRSASDYDELKKIIAEQGGFVRCYFEPNREAEAKIKAETKATVRLIPFDQPSAAGKCIYSGTETRTQVLFGQAY